MSKTSRKQQEDLALSKNNGASIKYRKRLAEEQEALEEQQKALQELADLDQEMFPEDYIKRPVWVLN